LRDELKTQSAESKMIDQFMKEGKLVPSELLVKLVQKKIESDKSVRKFLLDGFPRSLENVNSWKAVIGRSINMKYLLFFEVPLDVMEQRLLERA
jgi:adenylate kinase family enzyme